MLVFNRFIVASEADSFVAQAHAALAALAEAPGYIRGELTRSLDDPEHWCLLTEWENVGTYRRALGRFEVKMTATPLLAQSLMEPSAYETLASIVPGGTLRIMESDRRV
ncbi:MAG TPA: antibiotic biosynthesis monooxygenase [Micromonosporaceae bacterium]|nr:antibiotic biosynthesis monooxygenase [Micromonosporaceae bacterium]